MLGLAYLMPDIWLEASLRLQGPDANQPTRSRFSVVLLGPRANAELIHKFHVEHCASHATLPIVTLQISS
jgi:hypothetical protein